MTAERVPATPPLPSEPDRAWCVAGSGEGLVVGPARALGSRPDLRVRVALEQPRPDAAVGPTVREIRVAESGVREFTVTWHDIGEGALVALNPAGGNQIGWAEPGRDAFWFTPGSDALATSVYQRFLLRHLTTLALEHDLAGRSVHAVTARWGTGVLAVAGPTCSGKTRLVNHLAGAGLVGAIVDDDCPVITPAGTAATLVPRRYEVETACAPALTGLIVLSDTVTRPQPCAAGEAHDLVAEVPVPWPALWLPSDDRPELPALPDHLPALVVPAQRDDLFDEVADLVATQLSRPR